MDMPSADGSENELKRYLLKRGAASPSAARATPHHHFCSREANGIITAIAQWEVRHAEGIHIFHVKSDVSLSNGGTTDVTLNEEHTGDTARSNGDGFLA